MANGNDDPKEKARPSVTDTVPTLPTNTRRLQPDEDPPQVNLLSILGQTSRNPLVTVKYNTGMSETRVDDIRKGMYSEPHETLEEDDIMLLEGLMAFTEFQQPGKYVKYPQDIWPAAGRVLSRLKGEGTPVNFIGDNIVYGGVELLGGAIRGLAALLGLDNSEYTPVAGPGGAPPETPTPEDFNTVSVANPRISITEEQWNKMSDAAKVARKVNRLTYASVLGGFGEAAKDMIVHGEIRKPTTVHGAELAGTMAPPINKEEAMMDFLGEAFIGPAIASVPLFWPASAATTSLGIGRLGVGSVGRIAKLGSLGTREGMLSRFATKAGLSADEAHLFRALMTQREALGQARAAELALGLGFGGTYGLAEATESGKALGLVDTGNEALNIALGTAVHGTAGAALGFALAVPFRFHTLANAHRMALGLENALKRGVTIEPGRTYNIDGVKWKLNKNGSWIRQNDAGGWSFVSKKDIPDDIVAKAVFEDLLADPKALAEFSLTASTPAREAAKTSFFRKRGFDQSALQDPAQYSEVVRYNNAVSAAESDYYTGIFNRVLKDPVEVSKERMRAWASWAEQADTPSLRAEFEGRARAIQRILSQTEGSGVDSPVALEGIPEFDMEQGIHRLLVNDPDALDNAIDVNIALMADDHAQKSTRAAAETFVRHALRQRTLTRNRPHAAAADDLWRAHSNSRTRGLQKGAHIIDPDGHRVVLESNVNGGMATVKDITGNTRTIKIDDSITLIPQANKWGRLINDELVHVKAVDEGKEMAVVAPVNDRENLRSVHFRQFKELGIGGYSQKTMANEARAARKNAGATVAEAIEVEPRVVINKATGKAELVVSETPEVIVTSEGNIRVKDQDVVPESKGSKAVVKEAGTPLENPEVFIFEPGTKPAPGRTINFLEVPKDRVDVAIYQYETTGDIASLLNEGTLRVFPTSSNNETVLLAIDRAATTPTKSQTKTALGLLSGKQRLSELSNPAEIITTPAEFTPESLVNARVYEVPEFLRDKVRTVDDLLDMAPEDQIAALRKSQDFGVDVSEREAAAQRELVDASRARKDAVVDNDGAARDRADDKIAEAEVNLTEAILDDHDEITDAVQEVIETAVRRNSDIDAQLIEQGFERGDPAAVALILDAMPVSEYGSITQPMVFQHPEIPSLRMEVRKYQHTVPTSNPTDIDAAIRVGEIDARIPKLDTEINKLVRNRTRVLRANQAGAYASADQFKTRLASIDKKLEPLRQKRAALDAERAKLIPDDGIPAATWELRVLDGNNNIVGPIRRINRFNSTHPMTVAAEEAVVPLQEFEARGLFGVERTGYAGRDFPDIIMYTEEGVPVRVEKVVRRRDVLRTSRSESSAVEAYDELPDTRADTEFFEGRISGVEDEERQKALLEYFGPEKRPERRTKESVQKKLLADDELVAEYEAMMEDIRNGYDIDPKYEDELTRAYNNYMEALEDKFSVVLREVESGRLLRPVGASDTSIDPIFHLDDSGKIVNRAVKDNFQRPRVITTKQEVTAPDGEKILQFIDKPIYESTGLYRAAEGETLRPRFPRPMEEISASTARAEKSLNEIKVLQRVAIETDAEAARIAARDVSKFNRQRGIALTGEEMYSPLYPDIYATVYRDPNAGGDGWKLQFWRANKTKRMPRAETAAVPVVDTNDGTAYFIGSKRFGTRAGAEKFANEAWGFQRVNTGGTEVSVELQQLIRARMEAEGKLAELLPPGVNIRDALGDWDFRGHASKGGVSSRIIADNLSDEILASPDFAGKDPERVVAGRKVQATKMRKALSEYLARAKGYTRDHVHAAMFGEDRDAILNVLPKTDRKLGYPGWLRDTYLPDLVPREKMSEQARLIEQAVQFYRSRNNGWLPPELRNYASRFAHHYWDTQGRLPWSSRVRRQIGLVSPEDMERIAAGGQKTFLSFDQASEGPLPHGFTGEQAPPEFRVGTSIDGGPDQWDLVYDTQFIPGEFIGFKPPRLKSARIRALKDAQREIDQLVEGSRLVSKADLSDNPLDMTENFADAIILEVDVPATVKPGVAHTGTRRMFGGGKRLAKLVGFTKDNNVRVMFEDESVQTVSLDAVRRHYGAQPELDIRRITRQALGEPVVHSVWYPQGESGVDVMAGIDMTTTPDEVTTRLSRYADYLITGNPPTKDLPVREPLRYNTKAKNPRALEWDNEDVQTLVALHKRAVELNNPRLIGNRMTQAGLPESLFKAVQRRVFEETAAEWAGNEGLAHMVGKVKAGTAKASDLDALKQWAAARGIRTDNPVRMVEDLATIGIAQPELAQQMVGLNRQMGFLGWVGDMFDHDKFMQIKPPRTPPNELFFWQPYTASTRFVARRDPRFKLLIGKMYESINTEGSRIRLGRSEINNIADVMLEISPDRKAAYNKLLYLREVMDEHSSKTFDELKDAGVAITDDLREPWDLMKHFFDTRRDRIMVYNMRAGRVWRKFGELSKEQQFYIAQNVYGVPMNQLSDNMLILDTVTNVGNIRSKNEARQMVAALRQYDNALEFRAASPDAPEWMFEEFDLWKNYGLPDYWPYVHQGNYFINKVTPDGLVAQGTARSPFEAALAAREMVKRGMLTPDDVVEIKLRSPVVDDHAMLNNTLSRAQYKALVRQIVQETDIPPMKVSEVLNGVGFRPMSTNISEPNALARRAKLRNTLSSPLADLEVYDARLTRNEYLMDIDDAFSWFLDHQESLNKTFGTDPLQSTPNLNHFFQDMWSSAKGNENSLERQYSQFAAFADWMSRLPVRLGKKLANLATQERETPLFFGDPELDLHIRDYNYYASQRAASRMAGSIAHWQSFAKLGMSPAAAAVNLSQLLANTTAYVGEGYTADAALRILPQLKKLQAGKASSLDPQLAESLIDLLDDINAPMMRSYAVAAPGLAPIERTAEDIHRKLMAPGIKGKSKKAQQLIEYYGMWMFNHVEEINRQATAIAGYMKALDKGMSHSAAKAFAVDAVEATQFFYFDQAMPKLFRGPVAKVLFQFKTYQVGQMRFEREFAGAAIRNARAGDFSTLGAYARHLGYLSLFQGARAITNHPILAPLVVLGTATGMSPHWVAKKILGWTPEETQAKAHLMRENNESTFIPNLVTYGPVGALLKVNLGDRVGVSAQDFDMRNSESLAFGPHGSAVVQFGKMFANNLKQRGAAGVLPGVAGALGASALARGLTGAPIPASVMAGWAITQDRYDRIFGGGTGSVLGSSGRLLDPDTWDTYGIPENPEARRWVSTLIPQLADDIDRMAQLAGLFGSPGEFRDTQGRRVTLPATGNIFTEMLYTGLGGATTQMADYYAWEALNKGNNDQRYTKRSMYLTQAAMAMAANDTEKLMKIKAAIDKAAIMITDEDIRLAAEKYIEPRARQVYEQFLDSYKILGEVE